MLISSSQPGDSLLRLSRTDYTRTACGCKSSALFMRFFFKVLQTMMLLRTHGRMMLLSWLRWRVSSIINLMQERECKGLQLRIFGNSSLPSALKSQVRRPGNELELLSVRA